MLCWRYNDNRVGYNQKQFNYVVRKGNCCMIICEAPTFFGKVVGIICKKKKKKKKKKKTIWSHAGHNKSPRRRCRKYPGDTAWRTWGGGGGRPWSICPPPPPPPSIHNPITFIHFTYVLIVYCPRIAVNITFAEFNKEINMELDINMCVFVPHNHRF